LNNLFNDSSNFVNNIILEKTEVVYGIENIIARAIERWKNTEKKMDSCIDRLQPKLLVTDNVMFSELVELVRKDIKTRTIFEITEENVYYIKELMELIKPFGKKHVIRHLDNVIGNFSISDEKIFQSHVMGDLSIPRPKNDNNDNEDDENENEVKQKESKSSMITLPQCILSNVHAFVEQQQNIFELMWQKALSAEQRIREIEYGIEPEVIETIKDKEETQNLLFSLLESANEEILVIFSTSNEFHRQENAGFFKVVKKVKAKRPWINVCILTPKDNEIESRKLKEFSSFNILFAEPLQRVSVLVVDKKYSLTVELKDDTKQQPSIDAIGLASYSNSLPTVLSYISVFETLRKQTELLERLKYHDKIQQEFINIAAHELRNPLQPILGLSKIVKDNIKDKDQRDLLDVIIKNTNRLKSLTDDILDVTRIESHKLLLNKEPVCIWELVHCIIKEFQHSLEDNNKIQFELNFNKLDLNSVNVIADRNRISQVITNLINNSIKFIPKVNGNNDINKGIITISVENAKINEEYKINNISIVDWITISIKDNGTGIDLEIFPRLFTKFASKSFQGTGLGLYICKNIIKAHGGKIWAKNNENEKGATFGFSLPFIS